MNRKRDTVVLGQQLADAKKSELSRLAAGGGGRSPMPKQQYDEESGDFNLENVTRLAIDDALHAFTNAFRQLESDQREDVRRSISLDEFYTLIHFAKRSAVLALREGSAQPCESGLAALALIDETRIDQRDAAWAAGLLGYAATVVAESRQGLFESAIAIARPGIGDILRGASRSADLSDWGYAELRSDNGLGLIESDWAPYEPTLPLDTIALTIADWLNGQRYVAHPKIAVEVPVIWFAEKSRKAAQARLDNSNGAVSISGKLRKSYFGDAGSQMFVHWVVELSSKGEAEELVSHVGSGSQLSGRFSIGYSVGNLFGLLVAGSIIDEVRPYESRKSLVDLVKPLQSLISEMASRSPL